jgi:hypothetical protein
MQTSGNRSSFYRPANGWTSRVAGVGLAVGVLLAAAAVQMSCSPGSLPADFPVGGSVTPGTGGISGGNTGGTMMGTGGMPATGDMGTRPLANCAAYPTVNDYETKLLVPQCGKAGCHTPSGGLSPPDMASPNIYSRLIDKFVAYTASTCDKTKDKLIDSGGTADASFFVSKIRDKAPKCPSGPAGGLQMPFGLPPLAQSDIDCSVAYVNAILGK